MKKMLLIFFAIAHIIFIGCSKTYYGKFITTEVKQEPIDEFQTDGYTVLAFENIGSAKAEDWKWEFWVFWQNKKVGIYKLQSRIVGEMRSYYLVEEITGMRPSTISNFPALPNYERVKERLSAHLTEKGAPSY